MTPPTVEYAGKDLEAMAFAEAYHRWILHLIHPYLGKHIVEVGAGTGSFSTMLLETEPESLTLIEPSEMFSTLAAEFELKGSTTKVTLYNNVFSSVSDDIRVATSPDSILYINVLEHIDDDAAEIQRVRDTLAPNGHLILFVPALPMLFSKLDKQIGHFRRYRRQELKEKCESVGFKILDLRWFDMPGILPWFIKYRLLGSLKVEPAAVRAYDRLVVPIVRPVETLLRPPIGKNLLLIAERV